jgi:hypothetical protein
MQFYVKLSVSKEEWRRLSSVCERQPRQQLTEKKKTEENCETAKTTVMAIED